jgi:FtsP/CotA-like multicopper oxidase with cupredoxin domain
MLWVASMSAIGSRVERRAHRRHAVVVPRPPALLTALLLALAACRPAGGRRSPERAEFEGSYPIRARPTGVVREFALRAAPTQIPLIDGRALDVWAYNGQVPGPTLRVRVGDTVRVRFTNDLPQPTTIHWHGMRIPNAMDGVPGVTQPPIPPGGHFDYEFVPKDAGTFWFHPHLRGSEQLERGLFGVLVVEEADPPPYSKDVIWVIDDWLLGPDGQIAPQFNTRHDLAHDGRWGNEITVNGTTQEKLAVRPGERIRLRLVDVANGRVFAPDFSALGDDAKAIAVDGLYAAQPFDPKGFELAPGNRLDLDLTIPASMKGQRVAINDLFTRRPIPLAEIVVGTDAVETPRFPSPARAHVPRWQTVTTQDAGAPPPRKEYRLNAQAGGEFGIQWTLNGEAFTHADHAGPHPRPHDVARLPIDEWSRIRFVNETYRLHPMHMHGVFFKLLSRNGTPVEEPHFRDTVLVHAKETVEVGLVPEDPGLWMMHCHIQEHAESGMMTLFEVR